MLSHECQTATCRSGATLMFSGIFLGLVGMTFTDMGWLKYSVSCSFKWTQLLSPILLSVGGTFILISICKFRMLSCRACKQSDYDKDLSESLKIPGSGQSFVFNGINQPIMFHGATVGQDIPAPYGSVTGKSGPRGEKRSSSSASTITNKDTTTSPLLHPVPVGFS
ncbi:transmembrane protein 174 [Oncorhynchus mykiss]|uniref:transmembrane protein 174 n=1 Tax=Oncorhynchus mykiss TaxID=8022 RepID=UPI001877DC26|nr:transmembrane protein 174 [Oncorhynchus mykiss]